MNYVTMIVIMIVIMIMRHDMVFKKLLEDMQERCRTLSGQLSSIIASRTLEVVGKYSKYLVA